MSLFLISPPRLSHTKAAVKAALADDFDTPRAVDAIMDLIHHGNRQLKAVTKVAPRTGPQSRVLGFSSKNRHNAPSFPQLVASRHLLTNL